MKKTVSDFIVDFFVNKNINDFFGFQGTMISYFVDAIGKNGKAFNHSCYNEQGASFAACGYALATGKCGIAYATSGPGAANLISGIANAYYDSIPVVFITGQINTYEYYKKCTPRQQSFQEIDIVNIVKPITLYTKQIKSANDIRYELEKAYKIATEGRKGPVLLDIPMNIQRQYIEISELKKYSKKIKYKKERSIELVLKKIKYELEKSKRPVLLLGNGVERKDCKIFYDIAKEINMPVVTTLLAKDRFSETDNNNFGYIGGAYGKRHANMIVAKKADLIIAIGASLCRRQTGVNISKFAAEAKIIRLDIDREELRKKVGKNEIKINIDYKYVCKYLLNHKSELKKIKKIDSKWITYCQEYKSVCDEFELKRKYSYPNKIIKQFSELIPEDSIVCCDVGQHMLWVAQSFCVKKNQKILFSGGHGAMGFALPAAIGCSIAFPKKKIYCICGDGSLQMNIQELQWIKRENLNITILVLNNKSLGLIVQQQDTYFNSKYFGSCGNDYEVPDFTKIVKAYGIKAAKINDINKMKLLIRKNKNNPSLIEFIINKKTKAYPKTVLGQPIYNQEPTLPDKIYKNFLEKEI